MEKIKEFFLTNAEWKITSLVIAIAFWFVATNINNPVISQTFTMPLELVNTDSIEENDLILLNYSDLENQEVEVRVKGTRNDINNFRNAYIDAYVDFSPVNITSESNIGVPVTSTIVVESNNTNYEILDYAPKTVELLFDRLETQTYPVSITEIGEPKEGYKAVAEPDIVPEEVTITGGATQMEEIYTVSVEVDLTDLDSDLTGTYKVNLYDESGNNINDDFQSISPEEVEVTTYLDVQATIPIDAPRWTGTVASGYVLMTPASYEPEYVEVYGNEDVLAEMTDIELDPVDVSGATEDVVVTYDLNRILLDSGLTIVNGTPDEVVVVFEVEPIVDKTLDVPTNNLQIINEPDNYEMPTNFQVDISGPESVVSDITIYNLTGEIDLGGLVEGENQVTPTLNISNEVRVNYVEPLNIIYYGDEGEADIDSTEENIEATEEPESEVDSEINEGILSNDETESDNIE